MAGRSLDADVLRVRTELAHEHTRPDPSSFTTLRDTTASTVARQLIPIESEEQFEISPSDTGSPLWKPVIDTPYQRTMADSWHTTGLSVAPKSGISRSLADRDSASPSPSASPGSPSWGRMNVGSHTRPDLSTLILEDEYEGSFNEDSPSCTATGSKPIMMPPKPKSVVSRSSAGRDSASASASASPGSPSWGRMNVGSQTRPDLSTLIFDLEENYFNDVFS